MSIKNPTLSFLNHTPNPTLQEVMQEVEQHQKTPTEQLMSACFLLSDILQLHKDSLDRLLLRCTPEVFAIHVVFQAIGNSQSGGLAVGIFANSPQLAAFIPKAAATVGYADIGEAIQKVKTVFPAITSFSHIDELYTDIINMMENPKRKVTHSLLSSLSHEEKMGYHHAYNVALENAEPLLEAQWYGTALSVYRPLQAYWQAHQHQRLFKPQITEEEYQILCEKVWLFFLDNASPKAIFNAVVTSNWDDNKTLLQWLRNNNDVDKAAILAAYWMSAPKWFKQFSNREDCLQRSAWSIDTFDFIEDIEKKYLQGFYSKNDIAYDPIAEGWTEEYSDIQALRSIPTVMLQPLQGQEVIIDYDNYTEGLPSPYNEQLERITENHEIIYD